jgi:hypothetical protein
MANSRIEIAETTFDNTRITLDAAKPSGIVSTGITLGGVRNTVWPDNSLANITLAKRSVLANPSSVLAKPISLNSEISSTSPNKLLIRNEVTNSLVWSKITNINIIEDTGNISGFTLHDHKQNTIASDQIMRMVPAAIHNAGPGGADGSGDGYNVGYHIGEAYFGGEWQYSGSKNAHKKEISESYMSQFTGECRLNTVYYAEYPTFVNYNIATVCDIGNYTAADFNDTFAHMQLKIQRGDLRNNKPKIAYPDNTTAVVPANQATAIEANIPNIGDINSAHWHTIDACYARPSGVIGRPYYIYKICGLVPAGYSFIVAAASYLFDASTPAVPAHISALAEQTKGGNSITSTVGSVRGLLRWYCTITSYGNETA